MDPQPFDNDALHFPLLQSFSANPDAFVKVKRRDVDALGLEVTKAFRRCCVPESNVSDAERAINELMLGCIGNIDSRLHSNSMSNPKAGATLLLFRRVMCTAENVTALCQMADPTIRTGRCRCHAIWHLDQLRTMNFCWELRLVDGTDRSFLVALTEAMAGVLDARIDPGPLSHRQPVCPCAERAWTNLPHSLAACTDPPEYLVNMLLKYDWPTILTRPDAPVTPNSKEVTYYAMLIFHQIHKIAVRLLAEDEASQKARELLASLGRCSTTLLQEYLKDIIAKKVWSRDGEGERFEEMAPIVKCIDAMLHCLVPLPENDQELDALVRRGRGSLLEVLMLSLLNETTTMAENPSRSVGGISLCHYVFDLMDDDQWHALKQETEAARWQRFKRHYLVAPDRVATDHSAYAKAQRKFNKKEMKKSVDLSRGEICANCFVPEKKLRHKLRSCSRCQQIKYCTRNCQVEHWKRSHKTQCSPVKLT